MEIERKIIIEIDKNLKDKSELDDALLHEINKLIVYQSVSVTEKEKLERDAIIYIENKLYDLIQN